MTTRRSTDSVGFLLCVLLPGTWVACGSSGDGTSPGGTSGGIPSGGTGGGTPSGGGLHGPAVGEASSGSNTLATMSGTLASDGSLELVIHAVPSVSVQMKLTPEHSFSGTVTMPSGTIYAGQTAQLAGQVALQPGAKNKFVITGTFTWGASNGTFSLRSLDWEVLDGLNDPGAEPSSIFTRGFDSPQMAFLDGNRGFLVRPDRATFTNEPAPLEPAPEPTSRTPVYATSDGGKTWSEVGKVPGTSKAIASTGQTLWVATSAGLFASADLGRTSVQHLGLPGLEAGALSGYETVVDFFDAQHGLLFSPNHHRAWVTQDGGKTWTASGLLGTTAAAPAPFTDAYRPSKPARMLSATDAFIEIGRADVSSGYFVYHTADAGATWQHLNPDRFWQNAGSSPSPACELSDMVFPDVDFSDGLHGWATTYLGSCVATTDDGGKTWSWTPAAPVYPAPPSGLGSNEQVFAVDANTAWVIVQANDILYLTSTSDRGKTFALHQLACTAWHFTAVSATHALVNCAPSAGGTATLQVTNDGGATFALVPTTLAGDITAMRMFPDGTGVLLSADQVFSTTDGGATWTAVGPLASIGTGVSFLSATEWFFWDAVGLRHATPVSSLPELLVLAPRPTALAATPASLWVGTEMSPWVAMPLVGGPARAVDASSGLWPLTDQVLVAVIEESTGDFSSSISLKVSRDGGATWSPINGLPADASGSSWRVCAYPTGAWLDWMGESLYAFDGQNASLLPLASSRLSLSQPLFCDASRLWFVDGEPRVLAAGAVSEQVVPLEWIGKSAKPITYNRSVVSSASLSFDAAWLMLEDGRIMRFLTDEAYATTTGPAVLGTAPSPTTPTSGNQPPTLGEITGVVNYNYDIDGNYLGGTISLSTYAGDPDGDKVTITWSLEISSGGPTLTSTTGNSTTVVLDSFSAGNAVATASDGKGGTATQRFHFSGPGGI